MITDGAPSACMHASHRHPSPYGRYLEMITDGAPNACMHASHRHPSPHGRYLEMITDGARLAQTPTNASRGTRRWVTGETDLPKKASADLPKKASADVQKEPPRCVEPVTTI